MVKDTKEKILDAAEMLFSKNGISTTSLRTIISQANVNIAAIHYHFGSRQEVIRAVFERRISPVNERRIKKLDELEEKSNGGPIDIGNLVDAFLSPVIDELNTVKKMQIMKGLMSRIHLEPDEVTHCQCMFDDIFERFMELFEKSLPHLSNSELLSRFKFMIGAMGIAFMTEHIVNKKDKTPEGTINSELLGKRLIQFITAGFEAPATV